MSKTFDAPMGIVDQWIKQILESRGMSSQGLELVRLQDGMMEFRHPRAQRILFTQDDIYIGEGAETQIILGFGYASEIFQDYISSSRLDNPSKEVLLSLTEDLRLRPEIFTSPGEEFSQRMFRRTRQQYQ